MTGQETIKIRRRFAACTAGGPLLSIALRVARRAPASESISKVHLSAGGFSREGATSGLTNIANLKRCEIFRGKIPRAKLKTKNTPRTKDAFAPNL
jgi:hypothetical protein